MLIVSVESLIDFFLFSFFLSLRRLHEGGRDQVSERRVPWLRVPL